MEARVSNRRGPSKRREAARILEGLSGRYDRRFLKEDPVWYAHQYADPRDQEIVAFLSALLAFGNVKAIHASIGRILDLAGDSPSGFVRGFDPAALASRFGPLGHRWVRGADLLRLFGLMRDLVVRHGSLKASFLAHLDPSHPNVGRMIEGFSQNVFSRLDKASLSRGFRYFFPSPSDGSPCKRLALFLRWMVRPADGIDLGLWPEVPASKLVIPLDTHVYRFAQRFRLSPYKTPRWEVAIHVTDFLKEIDVKDPVRFDFPICHYGMEEGW